MPKYVGVRIKELRNQQRMTLKELGEAVDFNYSNMSKIERGVRKPNVELLERIANYFNVEISYFFEKSEKTSKEVQFPVAEPVTLSEDVKNKNISIEDLKQLADKLDKMIMHR